MNYRADALQCLQDAVPPNNYGTAFLDNHHDDLAALVQEKGLSLTADLLGLPSSTLRSYLEKYHLPIKALERPKGSKEN